MSDFGVFDTAVKNQWNTDHHREAARDSKILGYLDTGFPEELAIAAGLHSVLLTGDPKGSIEHTVGHVDLGIPGRARQLYEGFLSGRYDFTDAVVVTGGDRYLANTYGFLQGYRRMTNSGPKAKLFYLERARGTYREHRDFNRDRLALLRTALGEFTGTPITDTALREAIALVNSTRRLLGELAELRIAKPGIITGVQAATISLASRLIPKEEFNQHLRHFIDQLPSNSSLAAGRSVYLTGSPVDHLGLHAAVEAAGFTVIGEDLEFVGNGDSLLIREDLEPLEAIADRYTYRFPDRWTFGRERRIKWNAKNIRAAHADHALFFHSLYDSGSGWDYPDLRNTLEPEEISLTAIQDQPYLIEDDRALVTEVTQALQNLSIAH